MKCKCGNEWVFRKHPRGDMLVCDTCNVEWDADEVIRELKGENNDLKAKNNALAFQNGGLELENERLRETIREALNSNDFAARMAKEPPATDSYGINARRLWSMKKALENNDD